MTILKCILFICALGFILSPLLARGDEVAELRNEVQADRTQMTQLNNRISSLESTSKSEDGMVLLFIVAVLCALWRQNTGRNAWLWFFLGFIFNVVTLLVLLAKNSGDVRQTRRRQTQIYQNAL